MEIEKCYLCSMCLEQEHVALNKKMLGRKVKKNMCLTCFADYLSCTIEDLETKIEEFKEQGCGLFKY